MADRKPLYINSSGVKTVFQTGDTVGIANGGTGAADAPNARINLGLQIGTNVQAWDPDLDAVAALSGTGFAVRSASNTWVQRTLTAPAAGFTITNNDGVSGNPTFVLANDLAGLEGLASTGFAVRTGTDTWAQRTLQGTATRISVTNGSGVSGDPTIDLITVSNSGTGTFVKLNIDSYGRVTGTAAVAAGDITALVDATYVNVAGDTMTNFLTLHADPSSAMHAVTKQYADAIAQGMRYKESVRAATTAALALTSRTATTLTLGGTTLTIDGQSMANGDRMLVKDSTTGTGSGAHDNGIYTVGGIGSSVVLTRALDADTTGELKSGDTVWVNTGTVNADTAWTITTDAVITIGTTVMTWSQTSGLGQVIAGGGLTKTGNQLDIVTASSARIVINADSIDLATVTPGSAGSFLKFNVDSYGRIANTTAVVGSDISALLDADLNAIAALGSTGFAVRTAADTWAQRQIATASSGRITVTNGTGVSGDPTLDLASGIVTPGTYNSVTVDTYGRVTAGTTPFADKLIIQMTNGNGSTINKCQTVYVSAAGAVSLARADVLATAKNIGLVFDTTIANAASGNLITNGTHTATTGQWDAVTGQSGGLTQGAVYYLSTATAGAITTTVPTTGYLIPVGIGLSTTLMRLYDPDIVQL